MHHERKRREEKKTEKKKNGKRVNFMMISAIVGLIARFLNRRHYAQHVGSGSLVCLSVILKYLTAKLAGNAVRENKKTIIVTRHIQLAVRNDEELGKLLESVMIANDDVHRTLLPKKAGKGKGKGENGTVSQEF